MSPFAMPDAAPGIGDNIKLATRARVKDRIGTSESAEDTRIDELLEVSTRIACDLIGTDIRRQASATLYPWGTPADTRTLRLPYFPIESITSIKQAYIETYASDWDSVDTLVQGTDYIVIDPPAGDPRNIGAVRRANASWVQRPHHIQVIGTFGFSDPDNVPSGGITPPIHLQEAIVADTIMRWQHRNSGGVGSTELPGSSSTLKAHPALVDACKQMRRLSI